MSPTDLQYEYHSMIAWHQGGKDAEGTLLVSTKFTVWTVGEDRRRARPKTVHSDEFGLIPTLGVMPYPEVDLVDAAGQVIRAMGEPKEGWPAHPLLQWPDHLRINTDGTAGPERRPIAEDSGTILSRAPWLTVDGVEIPPAPVYARRTWWQRLLRMAPRQTGWSTGSFTAPSVGVVVVVEMREVR